MKKMISMLGIIGMIAVIIFSLIDHFFKLQNEVYGILIGISFVLFLPMLIREIFSFRKENLANSEEE